MNFHRPAVGRLLACIRCDAVYDVLEACMGATTDVEHQWIDPETFVCGACLEAAGETARSAAA